MKKQVSFLCAALMMGMSMAYFSGCNDNNRIAADMAVDFAARKSEKGRYVLPELVFSR